MIRVNLLEMRQPVPEAGIKRSGSVLSKFSVGAGASGVLAAAIVIGCIGYIGYKWVALNGQISDLQEANARADQEKKELEKALQTIDQYQGKKKVLELRVQVISDLKRRQSVPVHLLDQVSKQLPEFLWLDGMDEKSNAIQIKGRATTYNAVSNFYNNLKDSPFFSDVTMGITQRAPEGVSFLLSCKFIPPGDKKAAPVGEDGAAQQQPPAEQPRG